MKVRSTIFVACATALLGFAGCAPEPGSERWCSNKAKTTTEERAAEWTVANWDEYSELCFEKGSKGWCDVQRDAPKDDWGLSEVTYFGINCMLTGGTEYEEAVD